MKSKVIAAAFAASFAASVAQAENNVINQPSDFIVPDSVQYDTKGNVSAFSLVTGIISHVNSGVAPVFSKEHGAYMVGGQANLASLRIDPYLVDFKCKPIGKGFTCDSVSSKKLTNAEEASLRSTAPAPK